MIDRAHGNHIIYLVVDSEREHIKNRSRQIASRTISNIPNNGEHTHIGHPLKEMVNPESIRGRCRAIAADIKIKL